MVKATLYFLFNQITSDEEREKKLQKVMTGSYEEMDNWERSFYTMTLLLGDIENNAKKENLYEEKEILEPGDPNYVEPTQE